MENNDIKLIFALMIMVSLLEIETIIERNDNFSEIAELSNNIRTIQDKISPLLTSNEKLKIVYGYIMENEEVGNAFANSNMLERTKIIALLFNELNELDSLNNRTQH